MLYVYKISLFFEKKWETNKNCCNVARSQLEFFSSEFCQKYHRHIYQEAYWKLLAIMAFLKGYNG
jgi:hypothetical protein